MIYFLRSYDKMTWGWDTRGNLPVDNNVGATGGGNVGTPREAAVAHAWPRYEAEYLKRALQSQRHKYDAEDLEPEEKAVYLDRVTQKYKEEADEALKGEFDQWLQGMHEANDMTQNSIYVNADGKPIRRWVYRSKEAEDSEGGSKVGQSRAGWKHTPWGRAPLTHLPGVQDYLRGQKEKASEADLKMQLLAEHGPQNIEDAWKYFKHWVKGRPVTDAVTLPPHYDQMSAQTRTDFKGQMPSRMYTYDPDAYDNQPGVLATDPNAYNAAVTKGPAPLNDPAFDVDENATREQELLSVRQFRERLEGHVASHTAERDAANVEARAEALDQADEAVQDDEIAAAKDAQVARDAAAHDKI